MLNILVILTWNLLYKFYMKLIKYNIIKDVFKDTSKFINNKQKQIYITDTTLIRNINGIDNISHNPIDNKHNTTKISKKQ
jgi:hypothetical protein